MNQTQLLRPCFHLIKFHKWTLPLSFLTVFLAGILFYTPSLSQGVNKIRITGVVKDSATGSILIGVVIAERNHPNIATTSNENGQYILDVTEGSVLVSHYLGYVDQEVFVGNKSRVINFTLKPQNAKLNEVVVTAFGRTERKEAVVGSVTSVNPSELKIPASNLTNALAGKIAGIIAFQRSGQPGADNSSFFIRGVTTLGYSASPLILVDNIELSANDLARLNVDDIAKFLHIERCKRGGSLWCKRR